VVVALVDSGRTSTARFCLLQVALRIRSRSAAAVRLEPLDRPGMTRHSHQSSRLVAVAPVQLWRHWQAVVAEEAAAAILQTLEQPEIRQTQSHRKETTAARQRSPGHRRTASVSAAVAVALVLLERLQSSEPRAATVAQAHQAVSPEAQSPTQAAAAADTRWRLPAAPFPAAMVAQVAAVQEQAMALTLLREQQTAAAAAADHRLSA
jgi:hypothetical protein